MNGARVLSHLNEMNCVLLRENVNSLSKNGSHHLRSVDIQPNHFGGESTLNAEHCQKCITRSI